MQFEPRLMPRTSEIKSPKQLEQYFPPVTDSPGKLEPHEYEFFQHGIEVPFETTVRSYSPVNAWYLSDLAFLAYTDCPTAADVERAVTPALTRLFRSSPRVKVFLGSARRWGKPDLEDPIQCIVAHDASVGFVAFRGTLPQSTPNWLTDAELIPRREGGPVRMLVHEGFQGALDGVWQSGQPEGVEQYLAEIVRNSPNLPWWFTGHSLGAALATLAVRRFGHAHALYTYGSPKVGDAAFVAQVAHSVATHYRIVNHRDIVTHFPHIPPFEHAGSLKQIEEPGTANLDVARLSQRGRDLFGSNPPWDATAQEFLNRLGQLKSNIAERRLLRSFADHAPIFYSKILWNRLIEESDNQQPSTTIASIDRTMAG